MSTARPANSASGPDDDSDVDAVPRRRQQAPEPAQDLPSAVRYIEAVHDLLAWAPARLVPKRLTLPARWPGDQRWNDGGSESSGTASTASDADSSASE